MKIRKCQNCNLDFPVPSKSPNQFLCSRKCNWELQRQYSGTCLLCEKVIYGAGNKKFCSKSCSTSYNNQHRKVGNRVSKLEVYLQQRLTAEFSELVFEFNTKLAINSELDIYIPSLKLAIELNGILHYEPVYGDIKLEKIQINDKQKMTKCYEAGIELVVVDTSDQKYFKESTSERYFDLITKLIRSKIDQNT